VCIRYTAVYIMFISAVVFIFAALPLQLLSASNRIILSAQGLGLKDTEHRTVTITQHIPTVALVPHMSTMDVWCGITWNTGASL